jgi:MerR family transcriptional regulator, redox-sensitive transcriptional activator SoxR
VPSLPRELTIGEVAARSGIATSALRFYEAEGLIDSQRTDGNQRRYDRSVLRRVAFVHAGRTAGISLAALKVALDTLPHDRTPTRRDWERLSRGWRLELDNRIAALEDLRDKLTSCIGCGCLSLQSCRLFNPDDEVATAGPGAKYLSERG